MIRPVMALDGFAPIHAVPAGRTPLTIASATKPNESTRMDSGLNAQPGAAPALDLKSASSIQLLLLRLDSVSLAAQAIGRSNARRMQLRFWVEPISALCLRMTGWILDDVSLGPDLVVT